MGGHGSWNAIVNLAALEMFTWTSSVILSLGVAVPLSSTTEWCLCVCEFSTLCTFLAPWQVCQANASSYPCTRGMVLTWAPKSLCDDHHPCTYLCKPLGNVFLNHATPLLFLPDAFVCYLLGSVSVHFLWHPLSRAFLFTGLAFMCYIMTWQMKEWK